MLNIGLVFSMWSGSMFKFGEPRKSILGRYLKSQTGKEITYRADIHAKTEIEREISEGTLQLLNCEHTSGKLHGSK